MNDLTQKEQLPVDLGISEEDFLRDAEENKPFERNETIVPFLRVLQPLSPAVQEDNPNYVPSSKAGMFLNVANEVIYDGKSGLTLIPVTHQKNYTEWTPISKGGGFVKDWGESLDWQKICPKNQINAYRPITNNGTEIVYAMWFFVMIVNKEEGTFDPVIMPFTGTQVKFGRKWAATLTNSKVKLPSGPKIAPYFFFPYHVTTFSQRNEKGSWYSIKIVPEQHGDGTRLSTFALKNGKELYNAAKLFKQSLIEGTLRAAEQERAYEADVDSGEQGEEVPF